MDSVPDTGIVESASPELSENASGACSRYAADLLAAQPFESYELGECLAAHDESAVFRATDRNMDRTVALKALRPWPGRENAVEDFFSQAGAVARVRHPGLARGLDVGRGGGSFFMAHELLRGESLEARLARRQTGRLLEKESLLLVRDLATILQGLFDIGQSHGDLRPSRVLLGDGGKPRLLGIGFSWTIAWPNDKAAFLAAPDYLSPERIAEEFTIDVRGDLYALGCLWHRALMGVPVFRGQTTAETLDMHLAAEPTPPREVDPRLSSASSQLILWLLEKDRDARPRTPRDFLRKLATHPLLADQIEEADDAGEKSDGAGVEDE